MELNLGNFLLHLKNIGNDFHGGPGVYGGIVLRTMNFRISSESTQLFYLTPVSLQQQYKKAMMGRTAPFMVTRKPTFPDKESDQTI
jgi:hypothetical protein